MIEILIGLGALVVGVLIGFFVGRAWARASGGDGEARGRADLLAAQNQELRDQARRDQSVLAAVGPLQEQLAQVRRQVEEMERQRAEQYGAIYQQLHVAAATDERLRTQTEALTAALHTTSARGHWGELALRRVLEISGMTRQIDFDEQASVRSSTGPGRLLRPDVTIRLPGGKSLAIDAKVPLTSFLRATGSSGDAAGAGGESPEQLMAQHVRAVKGHIDTLASKAYHTALPVSPEFVVMFLPAESLLVEAMRQEPGLLDYALAKGVVVATPSNLLAILKTVGVIWQQHTVEEQARELLDLGKHLYESLSGLGGHLGKLGSTLESAVKGYNAVVGSLEGRVLPRARRLDAFDTSKLEIRDIEGDRAQVRLMRAPELTDPGPDRPL
ncbi:MAG: DNA recombination protein RmuC [Bifidobacteriaceae bacterium]|jgi:DNA recombination protein RmuC|nr:DNA recombination protein RmuC [Bifidobacteriaceae bacterium]